VAERLDDGVDDADRVLLRDVEALHHPRAERVVVHVRQIEQLVDLVDELTHAIGQLGLELEHVVERQSLLERGDYGDSETLRLVALASELIGNLGEERLHGLARSMSCAGHAEC